MAYRFSLDADSHGQVSLSIYYYYSPTGTLLVRFAA